ncbi:tyrosine-protein phosphatase non-receptor type 23-like isoform X2 [Gigantopelta aegis]|nr:tyrosine-protein phosphatase non-receptor type 23-like isoform X2 [Gigantopelta aegis]
MTKNDTVEIQDCMKFVQDVVSGKYTAAKKDNDFVYHEKVPPLDSLPEIKGASLVKGISFNPGDREISGQDIFEKLVPMEAHEASSVYSEEKAKLLRSVRSDVDSKCVELEQFLSSLQLDSSRLTPTPERLPQELLEKCAAMSVRTNAIKELTDSMSAVSNVAIDVEMNISEILQMLNDEMQQQEEFEKNFGKKAPNIVLSEMRKECEAHLEKHKQGSQSNESLHKAMNIHITNLKLLAGPPEDLQKALPTAEPAKNPEDEAVIQELKRLLCKIDEMRVQRQSFLDQLRDHLQSDDITNVLVTQKNNSKEAIFSEQLKKHNSLVNLIGQNLMAQDNILRALTDYNARYATIRKATNESCARRDSMIKQLITSYEVYEDLLAKSGQGQEYYKKLEENVSRLLQRCRSVCKVQNEEREQIKARFAPKVPPPSRPTAPKPSGGPKTEDASQPTLPAFDGPKLKDYLPFMKPATFGPKRGSAQVLPEPDLLPHSSMSSGFPGEHNPAELPPPGLPPSGHAHQDIDQNLPPELAAQLAKLPQGFFKKMGGEPSLPDVQQPSSLPPSLPSHQGEFPADLPPEVAAQLAKLPPGFFSKMKNERQNPGAQPSSLPDKLSEHVSQRYYTPGQIPPGQNPAGQIPPAQIPPGQFHSGQIPAGQIPPGQFHSGQIPPGQIPPEQMNQISGQIPDVAAMSLEGNRGNVQPCPASHTDPSVSHQNPQKTFRSDNTNTVSSVVTPVLSSVHTDQSSHQHSFTGATDQTYNQQQMMPQQYQQQQQQPQQQFSQAVVSQALAYPTPSSGVGGPIQQRPAGVTSFQNTAEAGGYSQTQQAGMAGLQNVSQPGPYEQQSGQSQQYSTGAGHNQDIPVGPCGGSVTDTGAGYYNKQAVPAQYGYPQQTVPFSQYSNMPTPYQQQQPFQQTQASTGQPNQYPAVSQSNTIPPSVTQPSQPQTQNYYVQNTKDMQQRYQQPPAGNQQFTGCPQGTVQQVQPQAQVPQVSQNQAFSQQSVASTPSSQYVSGGQYSLQSTQTGYPNVQQQMYNQNCSRIPSQQVYQVSKGFGQMQIQSGPQPQPQTQPHPQPGGIKTQVPMNQNVQMPYSQGHGSLWQGPVAAPQASTGPVQSPQMYNSVSQGQAMSSSNYQQQYNPSQQFTGNVVPEYQKTVAQPGTSTSSGYYQQPPNQTFETKPGGVAASGQVLPQSRIPSSQYQQQTPNQGFLASQNVGPVTGQGQGQGQYSQPPHVMTPQGQTLPMKVQPAGQAPVSYQQVLQPTQVISRQSATPPAPFASQFSQQIAGGLQPQQTVGGIPPQQTVGGIPPQQTVGGIPPQQTVGGIPPQQTVGGIPPQQTVGGIQPQQQTPGGLQQQQQPPQQTFGGLRPQPQQTVGQLQPQQYVGGPQQQQQQQQAVLPQKTLTPDSFQPTLPPKSQPSGAFSLSRQGSSLDELLSSSPDNTNESSIPAPQIAPKVLTAQEIQQQKEEARKNKEFFESPKDPYPSGTLLNQFVTAVEAFGKTVDELGVTNVFGQTKLDLLWKELVDSQEHYSKKHSIAIARCYPMKNRDPDIMPYDETRVMLKTLKDDYINASWINDLAPSCPKFIATQYPIPVTVNDFWVMVYEQGVEVIVMITSEYETGKKYPCYWPTEKGKSVEHGPLILTLQSVKFKELWTERIIYLKHSETKQARTVVYLQYKNWPVSGFPENPSHMIKFITETHNFYKQQRSLMKPVMVHCGSGVGRSGAFLLVYTGMQEMLHGSGLIDVHVMAQRLLQKRKSMIQSPEQLKFCYETLLMFAEDFLTKQNVLVKNPHCVDKKTKKTKSPEHTSTVPPADDIILGFVNLQTIQNNVRRFGEKHPAEPGTHDLQGQTALETGHPAHKEDNSLSGLPDLIQQPTKTENTGTNVAVGTVHDAVMTSHDDLVSGTSSPHVRSRSGSSSSVLSESSMSGSVSSKSSPQHKVKVDGKGMPSSLVDLQNPNTFTLGPGLPDKKRITKSSFGRSNNKGLKESVNVPDDPLSSLDPLWSIEKETK